MQHRSRQRLLQRPCVATAAAVLPVPLAGDRAGSRPALYRLGRAPAQSLANRLPTLPSHGVVALHRAGFDPRPGDPAAFDALGTDVL
ncbi:MAG: hypothetical protein GY856_13680 [bacterium]|nr:hypothetical protein [bacterium]